MSLALFHFVIIPGTEDPEIFYFVVSVLWLGVLLFVVTTTVNLHQRSLLLIPTVLQCIVLCLMVYFMPVGICGVVLLYRRARRK